MTFERKTVSQEVVFEGLGLHSGDPVTVTVHPSEDGIWFRSPDGLWEAKPENVTDTSRCTRLGDISTIEHLMSAFCGLEITDASVELTAGELPALDGAAGIYTRTLMDFGFAMLGETTLRDPFSRIFVQEDDAKVAVATGEGHWRYTFETGPRWPGTQIYEVDQLPIGYASEIAPCRTFGFEEEIPHLQRMGLARGLDLSTALVLGQGGYVNEPKFDDEPTRHKMLDLMGDLYLAGVPARFLSVVAERSGHRLNVQAAARLYEAVHLDYA